MATVTGIMKASADFYAATGINAPHYFAIGYKEWDELYSSTVPVQPQSQHGLAELKLYGPCGLINVVKNIYAPAGGVLYVPAPPFRLPQPTSKFCEAVNAAKFVSPMEAKKIIDGCRCAIKNLLSTGHDSGCPERK